MVGFSVTNPVGLQPNIEIGNMVTNAHTIHDVMQQQIFTYVDRCSEESTHPPTSTGRAAISFWETRRLVRFVRRGSASGSACNLFHSTCSWRSETSSEMFSGSACSGEGGRQRGREEGGVRGGGTQRAHTGSKIE